MPRMANTDGMTYLGGQNWWFPRTGDAGGDPAHDSRLPDLTDHATLGCLLALVREAHGLPNATPVLHGWLWHISGMVPSVVAKSEAGVLVAALDAAP